MTDVVYNGQAEQDKFVLSVLKGKRDGFFLEIGSNEPIFINNTYLLESRYNWKGIMVEYEKSFFQSYKTHRPNSVHILSDATAIDYKALFETNNVPMTIDYLQIDLEVNDGTTIAALEKLDREVMDNYKFSVVTFEHDIYNSHTDYTRTKSREIFGKRGYFRVFSDINNRGTHPYEDWYVHPDLVDMSYIQQLQSQNVHKYRITNIPNIQSINYQDIEY